MVTKTYARIENGVVMEIITPWLQEDGTQWPVDELYAPAIVAELVEITSVDPKPDQRWTYDGSKFSPPTDD
jgi:hypothetical protein